MEFTAVLAGSIAGKMFDPLGWVALIGVIVLGARRRPWWMAMLFAIALTVVNVLVAYSRWAALGMAATWPSRGMLLAVVFGSSAKQAGSSDEASLN